MKTKQIQQFMRMHLTPKLEGYSVAGKILFQEPVSDIVRGFYFESSEFNPKRAYVWIFILPLYIPESYVHFQFGKRMRRKVGFLRTREDWDISSPCNEKVCRAMVESIKSQGIPYLSKLATPELIIRNLTVTTGLWGDPYVREAIAYSLARTGKLAAAKRRLQWLLRTVGRHERYEELKKRGYELLGAIREGPSATTKLLDAWTKQTADRLKLPL